MTSPERTVVFLDLARFTTLTDVHGDRAAAGVLDRFLGCVDGALQGQATVVKTLGDGVLLLAEEPSTGAAVAARVVARFHDEVGLPDVAGGVHHGPVLLRDGDVLGATVNLASRLADAAPPSEVYATERPARAAADAGLLTRPLGAVDLPGVIRRVEVYAISPCDHRADETQVDPVCGMRILPGPETLWHDDDGGTFWFCTERCRDAFIADTARYQP